MCKWILVIEIFLCLSQLVEASGVEGPCGELMLHQFFGSKLLEGLGVHLLLELGSAELLDVAVLIRIH